MNIGSLYTVKKYFWLIFPTKETAHAAPVAGPHTDRLVAAKVAGFYSKRLNCEVTCFSPDSYIVFLEEDGIYKKVLTSDGRIGWTWFNQDYISCFEEVKTEQ